MDVEMSQSVVLRALYNELKRVQKEKKEAQEIIDGFTKPFPKQEDYEGIDSGFQFIEDYKQYVEEHLKGKYTAENMLKTYEKKGQLAQEEVELLNQITQRSKNVVYKYLDKMSKKESLIILGIKVGICLGTIFVVTILRMC
jgi:hypothetical protein